MFGLTSSLGRSGLLAAWLAAWIPNLTFTILAASLFLFGEER
jgi:lipopolysaccharide export LptBFGC system permease protein LptF